RRRHTRLVSDWSSDVCSSDLARPCSRGAGSHGTVVHPPRAYVIIVTASLIVGAICLSILLAFIVFFAPREAHGVERLKQKISVKIGRASCRERGEVWVGGVGL